MNRPGPFAFGVGLLLLALISGCKKPSEDLHVQPGLRPGGFGQAAYMAVRIVKIYENQQPVERPPGHATGGDWTFMDCAFASRPEVKFVVGTRAKVSPGSAMPTSWGEATLSVENVKAGALFTSAFAEAFHTRLPTPQGTNPPGRIKMQMAMFGSDLGRSFEGGFKGKGKWSATKWFLQGDGGEAEVFFNFNLEKKEAEFAEKDPDYREELMEQLVVALRDGAPPERTPENDPTLSATGPRATDWKLVVTNYCSAKFSPDSRTLILKQGDGARIEHVYIAPVERSGERRELGSFTNPAAIHEVVSTPQGIRALITETIPTQEGVISSKDPQRLWLLSDQGLKQIQVNPAITNWYIGYRALSPEGAFVAVQFWRTQKPPTRVIQLYDAGADTWRTIEETGVVYGMVGWKTGSNGSSVGFVQTGQSFQTNEVRKAFSLDPRTGRLAPIEALPDEFDANRKKSPDGRRVAVVREKKGLSIIEAGSNQTRDFIFHPGDQKNLYAETIAWASSRYLVFSGSRPALIDTETMKMSFICPRDEGWRSIEFSPDFKWALGWKEEGRYLGRVEP